MVYAGQLSRIGLPVRLALVPRSARSHTTAAGGMIGCGRCRRWALPSRYCRWVGMGFDARLWRKPCPDARSPASSSCPRDRSMLADFIATTLTVGLTAGITGAILFQLVVAARLAVRAACV